MAIATSGIGNIAPVFTAPGETKRPDPNGQPVPFTPAVAPTAAQTPPADTFEPGRATLSRDPGVGQPDGKDDGGDGDALQPDPDVAIEDGNGRAFGNFTGQDPEALKHILSEAVAQSKQLGTGNASGPAWKSVGPSSVRVDFSSPTGDPTIGLRGWVSGRPRAILNDPRNPNVFIVGTAGGGIWKTKDAGEHWKSLSEKLPSQVIGSLAMDPQNPDNLYAGFGDPFSTQMPGFVRSTDGGAHWSDPVILSGTYPGDAAPVTATMTRDLKVSPDDPNLVLAATNAGLFRSTDAGKTFALTPFSPTPPPGQKSAQRGVWSLGNVAPHTWVASTRSGVGELWRSEDDGATWKLAPLPVLDGAPGRMTLAVAKSTVGTANPRVYALAGAQAGNAQLDVLRSDDGGQSWTALGVNAKGQPENPNDNQPNLDVMHGQAWYNQMLTVDPQNPDNLIIGGNLSVMRSNDGGKDWGVESNWFPSYVGMPSSDYVHADVHAGLIVPDGKGNERVIVGSDGGLFVSNDQVFKGAPGRAAWTSRWNRGLDTVLAQSLATSPSWTKALGGGLQDNGTLLRNGGGKVFSQVTGGDGFGSAMGNDPNIIMASFNGTHLRSADGGKTWDEAETGMYGSHAPFDVRYATVAGDSSGKTFLTGEQKMVTDAQGNQTPGPSTIFKTADGGATWTPVTGTVHRADGTTTTDGIPGTFRDISASVSQPNVWGAITDEGLIYSTQDGGVNWQESQPITTAGGPFTGSLNDLAFDPSDASGATFYAAAGNGWGQNNEPPGTNPTYLFKTTDRGATWSAINGTEKAPLPSVPTNTVQVDPSNPKNVYVGNVLGVYESKDSGQTWHRFGKGMPVVNITDLAVKPDGSKVRAASYGRGFWET